MMHLICFQKHTNLQIITKYLAELSEDALQYDKQHVLRTLIDYIQFLCRVINFRKELQCNKVFGKDVSFVDYIE